jgi:hypothetical protein
MKVHGLVAFKCHACGTERRMYCEEGVVRGEKAIAYPNLLRCSRCGSFMVDISGYMKLDCAPIDVMCGMDVLHHGDSHLAVPGVISQLKTFMSDRAIEEGRSVVTSD